MILADPNTGWIIESSICSVFLVESQQGLRKKIYRQQRRPLRELLVASSTSFTVTNGHRGAWKTRRRPLRLAPRRLRNQHRIDSRTQ
jgi:hypothetical protein